MAEGDEAGPIAPSDGAMIDPELLAAASIAVTGRDARVTAHVALGIARATAASRRTTIVDLWGGAEPLIAGTASDDPHGVADCFAYGISFAAATHATAYPNVYVIPAGTEPQIDAEILASPRWDRLIETTRAAGQVVVFIAPTGAPGLDAFLARLDRVVPVDPARERGASRASSGATPLGTAAGGRRLHPAMDQSRRSIALLAAAVLLVVVIVGGIARIAARRSARQSEATTVPVPSSDTTPQRAAADSTTASLTPVAQFVVQFVATRSIDTAHVVAARVRAPAGAAQILSEMKDGRPLYRVILGPYPTSATADSVGRAAHTAYWVRQAP